MDWDEYFMRKAITASLKSKDPSTRVGCALADEDNVGISEGYNGLPRTVPDDPEVLNDRAKKLLATIHAEENAIIHAGRSLKGATCYVWPLPPCGPCAARLAQAGIRRVVAPLPSPEHLERWAESFAIADWIWEASRVRTDFSDWSHLAYLAEENQPLAKAGPIGDWPDALEGS